MVSTPLVSICLTTYNRASVLNKTIDSLLVQSFPNFELIISDDCSSDATQDICNGYKERDSRVRYYRNKENLKMPGNLNAAIQRATGEYIANVHDGDFYRPDLIEKWKSALDKVPTANFVFNDYDVIRNDGTHRLYTLPYEGRFDSNRIALHYFSTFSSCVWGTVMARRKAYERVGDFNPRYGWVSDVDMWLRLAYDNDVAYVPEPLITTTPREANHPFAFVNWRLEFWMLWIYVDHLRLYSSRIPKEVGDFRANYPKFRRNQLLKKIALCFKYQRLDRAREGLAIWRDSDDIVLKLFGKLLGRSQDIPDWYHCDYWAQAQLNP